MELMILLSGLFFFACLWLTYLVGFKRGKEIGYESGMHRVLNEWKETLSLDE